MAGLGKKKEKVTEERVVIFSKAKNKKNQIRIKKEKRVTAEYPRGDTREEIMETFWPTDCKLETKRTQATAFSGCFT